MIWTVWMIGTIVIWLAAAKFLQSMYMLMAAIPVMMFVIGYILSEKVAEEEPPQDNTPQYFLHPGYKTGGSMRSKQTWKFANRYYGGWCMRWSVPALFAGELLFCFLQHVPHIEQMIVAGQVVLVVLPLFLTERAIDRTFDRNGERKI